MSDRIAMNTLRPLVDGEWYMNRYPDVRRIGADPVEHYIRFGADEGRDPNPHFDGAWYLRRYPDVGASGQNPLLHYLQHGAPELRDPHPNFDAGYYADQHPEAQNNPLIYHMMYGAALGWATRPVNDLRAYLPSVLPGWPCPGDVTADVLVPVYRGLEQTRRCILSVLDDPERVPGRLIAVDDCSPEPRLSAWLEKMAADGRIELIRNTRNMGFVSSVNRAMLASEPNDVVLLNSDTEVPSGWLRRLAGHVYAGPRIATASPFSNNATICGYPSLEGGPPALGLDVAELDAACRETNAGRFVEVPVTVGFCMYIRRAALRETGLFDAQAFGRGYGEEADFCMRSHSIGWKHRLACDVFVYHEGEVSFGADAPEATASQAVLFKRYPEYGRIVQRHVRINAAGPARFALTAALFRRSGLPVILMVSHQLGGGVGVHLETLIGRLAGRAHVLHLIGGVEGVTLTVPGLPGHPPLRLAADRVDDLLVLLRGFGLSRVHVHHTLGLEMDLRGLLHGLDLPFDVTVHDYYAICPQVNLLPQLDGQYCGEPGPESCNACIGARPSNGAADILSWRSAHAWLLREAARVLCPSEDARRRLARHGLGGRAVVAAHEPVRSPVWPAGPAAAFDAKGPRARRLRIAVLGVVADQKGAHSVAGLADLAEAADMEVVVVGYAERPLPTVAKGRVRETGEYEPQDLPKLLARAKAHAAWFPAQWPETYSYTLSAAIDAGLPIVATDIGAFAERLAGRPRTWLADPASTPAEWLALFETVRGELMSRRPAAKGRPRPLQDDFYATEYLTPSPAAAPPRQRRKAAQAAETSPGAYPREDAPVRRRVRDVRQPGRKTVVVIPERFDNGRMSPCAFIRLLLPLDHPDIGADVDVIVADAREALDYRPDLIATHRYAVPGIAQADELRAHCTAHAIPLLYDLDDDLLNIPKDHPEADALRPKAKLVAAMLRHADAVWTSTETLRASLAAVRPDARVVANGLDERLWSVAPRPAPSGPVRVGPTRILLMGTETHKADFAILAPALKRLSETFGQRVSIDVVGVTGGELPAGVNRVVVPHHQGQTYPAFVNWIARQPQWHVGATPLANTAFNACKSSIKTLDYAALGLAVAASDVGVYRHSLANGPGGLLAANTPADWYATLSRLVRDPALTWRLAEGARASYADSTLAAQAGWRREAWRALMTAPEATLAVRAKERAIA